jgi:hypothetical protein
VPIELGAEFIHGSAPELARVLHEVSLSSVDVGGERWTTMDGRLRRLDDFWERLDRVMHRLGGATRSRALSSFSSRGSAADVWRENAGSRASSSKAFTPLGRVTLRLTEPVWASGVGRQTGRKPTCSMP